MNLKLVVPQPVIRNLLVPSRSTDRFVRKLEEKQAIEEVSRQINLWLYEAESFPAT